MAPVEVTAQARRADRYRAVKQSVPELIDRCIELAPECGAIICHGGVYTAAADALREAGIVILHEELLPFPLGNWRIRFVTGFQEGAFALSYS